MPVDKVVVVFQLIPESTEFYEVTDPDLIPLFLACHGLFINSITAAGSLSIEQLEKVMFGEDGESRDPRVVPLTKRGPVVIDGSGVVAIVNTGMLL